MIFFEEKPKSKEKAGAEEGTSAGNTLYTDFSGRCPISLDISISLGLSYIQSNRVISIYRVTEKAIYREIERKLYYPE